MHPFRRSRTVVALAAGALLVTACAGTTPEQDRSTSASAVGEDAPEDDGPVEDGDAEPVLQVVATVAPVSDLVAQVGGDRVEVRSLVPPGADSHTYEPRPSDVGALEDADLYVGIGLALNDGALSMAEATVRDGVRVVRLGEEALEDDALVFDHVHGDGDGHGHGGGSDHGHDHDDEGGDHGHSHGDGDGDSDVEPGPNPHVWTSVRIAADLVDRIAVLLGDLDPEAADGYLERADAYTAQLAELDEATATATATIPDDARTLVTFHDAWTYFARDYDLEFATAVQPADFTEPSASEVRDVIDLVRELDVPAVFGSEVFPSRVLEAVAGETDAVYIGDLADDVLPGDPGDAEHSYLGLMRRNATTIVEGLGGDASALR